MLKLDSIYITGSTEDKLDELLEKYNREHPQEQLSYQQYCERLLDDAIFSAYHNMKN